MCEIPDVKILVPKVYSDNRGYFYESFKAMDFPDYSFVQDNCSNSGKNVLRGLHYQVGKFSQAKLITVSYGTIFDVVVDLRKSSPTFGMWKGSWLSSSNKTQLFIPPQFAHGFFVISNWAEVNYKTTNYYNPDAERTIVWNDPDLAIEWPFKEMCVFPILSNKDKNGNLFSESEYFE